MTSRSAPRRQAAASTDRECQSAVTRLVDIAITMLALQHLRGVVVYEGLVAIQGGQSREPGGGLARASARAVEVCAIGSVNVVGADSIPGSCLGAEVKEIKRGVCDSELVGDYSSARLCQHIAVAVGEVLLLALLAESRQRL